jgi:NAD(P)-dependent dehydrogenase (short-subunit alcohol dehydrogenase family)
VESLKGKVAVITAGASGMGLAMGRRFAREGMAVVLADVEGERLEAAVADLEREGSSVVGVLADIADPAAVEHVRDVTLERFGTVHILCNHAGVGGGGALASPPIDIDAWRRSLQVCLLGVLNGLNCFLPILLAQDDGHIVNTSSRQGLVATPGLGAYCAAKSAVVATSEVLAAELREQKSNVGISVLCPGGIRTRTLPAPENVADTVDSERRALLASRYAEAAEPHEVADLVLAAIRTKTLYILTHRETIDWMEDRFDRIKNDLETLGSLR